jgi:hypothetical protein
MSLSRNLGTLTSWNPLGHSRPVTGLLCLYLLLLLLFYWCLFNDASCSGLHVITCVGTDRNAVLVGGPRPFVITVPEFAWRVRGSPQNLSWWPVCQWSHEPRTSGLQDRPYRGIAGRHSECGVAEDLRIPGYDAVSFGGSFMFGVKHACSNWLSDWLA